MLFELHYGQCTNDVYNLGQYLTYFLKIFAGVHVTPTYIRKLLESDVALHGTENERKCSLYIYM